MAFGTGLPLGVDDLGSVAWQTYTPVLGGCAAGSTVTGKYRRIGETYDVQVSINHNGATTAQITVSLPATMSVINFQGNPIGSATYYDSSAAKRYWGPVLAPSASFTTASCLMLSTVGQMVSATTLPDGSAYAAGDGTFITLRCAEA